MRYLDELEGMDLTPERKPRTVGPAIRRGLDVGGRIARNAGITRKGKHKGKRKLRGNPFNLMGW